MPKRYSYTLRSSFFLFFHLTKKKRKIVALMKAQWMPSSPLTSLLVKAWTLTELKKQSHSVNWILELKSKEFGPIKGTNPQYLSAPTVLKFKVDPKRPWSGAQVCVSSKSPIIKWAALWLPSPPSVFLSKALQTGYFHSRFTNTLPRWLETE